MALLLPLFQKDRLLPVKHQLKHWRRANRRMGWGINASEFSAVETDADHLPSAVAEALEGIILCYGFGNDGQNNADAVLSGKFAWQYAQRRWRKNTWQCRYIDFDQPDRIRIYPNAPARPSGFYLARVSLPRNAQPMTVDRFRRSCPPGMGPEGLQMLCITNPHLKDLMNQRRLAFIALADYDVAPYGYEDFFDAMQMFCSNDTLGLGIGNTARDYPMFAIPKMTLLS